jgi:hypothetical protein
VSARPPRGAHGLGQSAWLLRSTASSRSPRIPPAVRGCWATTMLRMTRPSPLRGGHGPAPRAVLPLFPRIRPRASSACVIWSFVDMLCSPLSSDFLPMPWFRARLPCRLHIDRVVLLFRHLVRSSSPSTSVAYLAFFRAAQRAEPIPPLTETSCQGGAAHGQSRSCLGRVLGWRYAVNARYLPSSLYALARDDVPGLSLWIVKGSALKRGPKPSFRG